MWSRPATKTCSAEPPRLRYAAAKFADAAPITGSTPSSPFTSRAGGSDTELPGAFPGPRPARDHRRRGLHRLSVSPSSRDAAALHMLHASGFSTVATVTVSYDLSGQAAPSAGDSSAPVCLIHRRFTRDSATRTSHCCVRNWQSLGGDTVD